MQATLKIFAVRSLADRFFASNDPGRTVRAGRRRPTGGSSGPRERADAPRRERPSSGGGGFGTSGGGSGSSGGGGGGFGGFGSGGTGGGGFQLPTGGRRGGCFGGLGMIVIVLLVIFVVLPMLNGGGGGDLLPQQEEPIAQPTRDLSGGAAGGGTAPTRAPLVFNTTVPRATSTPRPASAAAGSGESWLVMMYQDADDKVLEQDITLDLNEAERVGSTDNVTIVAQLDRYRGGFSGDDNWTSARRYLVTRDNDLNRIGSELVEDLGEVNMSDTNTLVDFATWAMQTYPADRYALILSDHGMGWPGGWSDGDSAARASSNAPLGQAAGDQLFLNEIDTALSDILRQTGVEKFDLLGMDACLMGHIEVLSALEPHARYAVLSQETEPALGWAYADAFEALTANPAMDGGLFGQAIVNGYIVEDQRILDENARADLLRQTSGMSGLFGSTPRMSASQLAQQMGGDITLAAIDLSQVPALMDRTNDLAYVLQNANQSQVARAKGYARSFTSIFGRQVPPSYIDLGNFAQLLQREVNNQQVSQAASQVVAAIDRSVVAIKNGPNKRGATGVSVYFPNSSLYETGAGGPRSYTVIANRFAQDSLWDDFLAFHYTGQEFAADTTRAPQADIVPSRAPGAGEIQVSQVQLSNDTVSIQDTILVSSQIDGSNIGYIYLFVGYMDRTGQSIYIADMDYLDSGETREIDGVYYPNWGEGAFTLEFEWEPIVFGINDGQDLVPVMLRPDRYGATPEEATYRVDGIYTYADGERRYAQLVMQNGVLVHVYGFTQADMTGAPWEIVPSPGDTFTVLEQWLDTDASGSGVTPATQEGAILVFGDQGFTWEVMDAAAGEYVVGFIVEDLDGRQYASYAPVTVR